jgi:ABC-type nitrate/sulfonate/bicarbonate transport system substrate-binding protein
MAEPATAARSPAAGTIRLALMWTLQAQFAGYVVANETELPELELMARAEGRSPTLELLEHRAEYGTISPAHLLAAGSAARDLVLIALFMPKSPVRMVGLRERVGDRLIPRSGARIGVWNGEDVELRAMLALAGFDRGEVEFVPVLDETSALLDDEVDYVQATTYNELPAIAAAAGGADVLAVHDPASLGVDVAKDGLVVRRDLLESDREGVRRVLHGAIAGWRQVRADPAAAVDAMLRIEPGLAAHQQRAQLELLDELFDDERQLGRPAASDVERARHAARQAGDPRADTAIEVDDSLWQPDRA